MRFFDTHCHLASEELLGGAEELCQECEESGVMGVTIISADWKSLNETPLLAKRLEKKFPKMRFAHAVGIHPHEAKDFDNAQKKRVLELSEEANAIGETGLDYYYDHSDSQSQEDAFKFHIELAKETGKPLVIHCRDSAHEILKVLDDEKIEEHPNPGILHCFAESADLRDEFLKRGLFISFSGILSFKNAQELRETAKGVPLDKLLIETDAPWLAPVPHRGKLNEPSYVKHTFDALKSTRSEEQTHLAEQIWHNSCKLFGIDG